MSRNPFIDFMGVLAQFTAELVPIVDKFSPEDSSKFYEYEQFIERLCKNNNTSQEDIILNTIKPIVKSLNGHSKDILFRNASMFSSTMRMFNDTIDVAFLWRKQTADERKVMWDFIEQLYVIGYLVCYPDKRTKFLQLVKVLKQQQTTMSELDDDSDNNNDVHTSARTSTQTNVQSTSLSNQEVHTDQAINDISNMFGIQQNDPMAGMIGDIAVGVDKMVKQTDPSVLITKMMSGDMSMFEGLMQDVNANIEKKIETGELNREQLEAQAQSMMSKFQSMGNGMGNPMQQMQQMMMGMGQMPDMSALQGLLQPMLSGAPQPQSHPQPQPQPQSHPKSSDKDKKKNKKK